MVGKEMRENRKVNGKMWILFDIKKVLLILKIFFYFE